MKNRRQCIRPICSVFVLLECDIARTSKISALIHVFLAEIESNETFFQFSLMVQSHNKLLTMRNSVLGLLNIFDALFHVGMLIFKGRT